MRVDPFFTDQLKKFGVFNANGCFNCGTCSVTCPLPERLSTFPRKVMRFAIYGMKEKVISSLEPWLCYYCGDCSLQCPREAEPGESMMTLRRYLSSVYDFTGLSSLINSSGTARALAHLITCVVLILMVMFYHYSRGVSLFEFISTSMDLEHTFPAMTYYTAVVLLLPFIVLLVNSYRMYSFTVKREYPVSAHFSLYLKKIGVFFKHLFTQVRFKDCSERSRWKVHMLLFSGFTLMFTIKFLFLRWFQTDNIYPVYHPQRWLGYIAFVLITYGAIDVITGRVKKKLQMHRFTGPGDMALPVMLLLTAVSGILVHVFRYSGLTASAHFTYFAHVIIASSTLIVEVPFGKLSHVIYRPLAIYLSSIKESAFAEAEITGQVAETVA